jgi:hypothetical protein
MVQDMLHEPRTEKEWLQEGGTMVTGLEGLRIFQLAEKLADEIWEEVIT